MRRYQIHHSIYLVLISLTLPHTTDIIFENRSAAYYGEHPYTYSGITHDPRSISDNAYLFSITSYIKVLLPNFKFNSAMVHRYIDSNSSMPYHSDDEPVISEVSLIVSISLGETRSKHFKNNQNGETTSINLEHGDVLTMTKSSQELFSHTIPEESCKGMRISVTLCCINPATNVSTSDSMLQPEKISVLITHWYTHWPP